jgi:hypothetical protein
MNPSDTNRDRITAYNGPPCAARARRRMIPAWMHEYLG